MLMSPALQNRGTCHVFRLQVVLSVAEHNPLADDAVCTRVGQILIHISIFPVIVLGLKVLNTDVMQLFCSQNMFF